MVKVDDIRIDFELNSFYEEHYSERLIEINNIQLEKLYSYEIKCNLCNERMIMKEMQVLYRLT